MTQALRRFTHGKRHPGETILVQWTIDERLWRDFLSAGPVRARNLNATTQTPTPPEPFPKSGIEVVIRDDAAFVGEECISSFVPGRYHGVSVRGAQLKLDVSHEYGDVFYVLPISAHALATMSRLAEEWTAAEREAARIQAEEDARPTFGNRTRKWVEAHFIFVLLAFFFGVIPLVVWCATLLNRALGGDP